MEYEKCYVFEPEDGRPTKRRRIDEPTGLQTSWNLRKKTFQDNWSAIRERVDNVLENINSTTVDEVRQFLDDTLELPCTQRIPTGIILGGPDSASNSAITQQAVYRDDRRIFASLSSGSASNLKAALRTLIQKSTLVQDEGEDEYEGITTTKRRDTRLLNYDLQILYEFIRKNKIKQVVVSFEDTEAFDGSLLSELIDIISRWLDRIPFVCLFSVATSVEFLQRRLSRDAIRALDGRLFDVAPSGEEVETVFEAFISTPSALHLGPNLISAVLEQQTDYIQSIGSLVDGIEYGYMSAFYANALSVFLSPEVDTADISSDHFESVRTLDSFKTAAKAMLDDGKTVDVKEMLESDEILHGYIEDQLNGARLALRRILMAVNILLAIQTHLASTNIPTKSSLYVQALFGKLSASPIIRSLLLSIRKAPSDIALAMMEGLSRMDSPTAFVRTIAAICDELKALLEEQADKAKPLRSEEDIKNSTLRTTVVAQKVELSKQKSTLSKQDAAYTGLIRRFSEALEAFFSDALINPKALPLHEIFLYDLKSPYRDVFAPRPRFAVERALASPHDYLDCQCCGPTKDDLEGSTLSATQPATAILYQLYLESGNLMNASDLWNAYRAVVGEEQPEAEVMAQFQRGLAEMKYLGMLKATRKRADHIAKVAWRGL